MRNRLRCSICLVALIGMGLPSGFGQNGAGQMEAAAKQGEQVKTAMAASIQKQMANFRKPDKKNGGNTSGGFFVTESSLAPWPDPVATADCDALSPLTLESLATKAALAQHVSADLVRAVIRQESGGKPCAVSAKGAMGLMQLMPGTAEDLGVEDALDPEANVLGGAKFLRKLLDRFGGDLNRVLGAYNAGPERVDEFGGVPPFPETANYVDTIMEALEAKPVAH